MGPPSAIHAARRAAGGGLRGETRPGGGRREIRTGGTGMSDALSAGSPDRFGYEWHRYAEMRPEYEEQFRNWTVHLGPEDWRGKFFLDVGCGTGRNSYWPMTYGAAG